MTLKEKLKEQILDDGELDIFNLNVKNWPKDDEEEHMDLENHEFIELTEDVFKMTCGGDWQHPKILEIHLIDGELTVVSATNIEVYQEGMGEDKFIELLTS